MPKTPHASDSTEQRSAEVALRELINVTLGCTLHPETLDLGSGVKINVDGIDRSNRMLCEVYSRIGRLKGSQPDKVAGDMLKLMLAERMLGGTWAGAGLGATHGDEHFAPGHTTRPAW